MCVRARVCVCVCGGGGGGDNRGLVSPYVFINVFNNFCDKYVARSGVEVVSKWCRSGSQWLALGHSTI